MNKQQLQAALTSAATSTFEELALLLASDAAASDGGDAAGAVGGAGDAPLDAAVRVEFDGPWRGSVTLRGTADVLAAAAANMLGSEAAPDPTLRRDALGELANVICGNLLPMLAGRDAVFRLGAPRWFGADAATAAGSPAAVAALDVEGGRAEVTLHLSSAPDGAARA